MRRTLTTLLVAATIAIGTVASPTAADARWRHDGFPVAPIIGGLAAGALLGAALVAPPPYYAYAYEPVYQPAISDRDVTSGTNVSRTDGVGASGE